MNRDAPVRPKKHLGQHFLKDASVAEAIAEAIAAVARPLGGEVIQVEVGPGTGALTRPLAEKGLGPVYALEVDAESLAYLNDQQVLPAGQILSQDLLAWNPTSLPAIEDKSFLLVGNFPYNISSQIVFWAFDHRAQVHALVGMFQKEVAERIVAPPGSKVYGILSVLMQIHYVPAYLFTVAPGAFLPPPKVQSGVLSLVRRPTPLGPPVEDGDLKRVVKAAFNQRRKTLRNALRSAGFDVSDCDPRLMELRAEQVDPETFAGLAYQLQKKA
jgi:16S rRNA (adenine1518-N6/adenine1519-N6)-dimethyltransferase